MLIPSDLWNRFGASGWLQHRYVEHFWPGRSSFFFNLFILRSDFRIESKNHDDGDNALRNPSDCVVAFAIERPTEKCYSSQNPYQTIPSYACKAFCFAKSCFDFAVCARATLIWALRIKCRNLLKFHKKRMCYINIFSEDFIVVLIFS